MRSPASRPYVVAFAPARGAGRRSRDRPSPRRRRRRRPRRATERRHRGRRPAGRDRHARRHDAAATSAPLPRQRRRRGNRPSVAARSASATRRSAGDRSRRARRRATAPTSRAGAPNAVGQYRGRAVLESSGTRRGRASPELAITVYSPAMATWYGPGFFGRADGVRRRMTPHLAGRRAPEPAVRHAGRGPLRRPPIVVPVVDRGPFRRGAEWDLTAGDGRAPSASRHRSPRRRPPAARRSPPRERRAHPSPPIGVVPDEDPDRVLVTGATGSVGGRALRAAPARAPRARLVRDPRARDLPARRRRPSPATRVAGRGLRRGARRRRTRVLPRPLVGRGGAGDFAARDRARPSNFGGGARRPGVERVDLPRRARRRRRRAPSTCAPATRSPSCCAQHVPRARPRARRDGHRRGQRVVPDAAPLVERLPVMVAPALDRHAHAADRRRATSSRALADAGDDRRPAGRGPARRRRRADLPRDDARASPRLGRRPPLIVRVPVLSPRLSSYWVALVTPVELGLVAPARRRPRARRWSSHRAAAAGHQRRIRSASTTRSRAALA